MAKFGYHCSHEQFAPSALLHSLQLAEQAGFVCGMCSDHFHPWSERQGQSGHAWSWLGAAMQATSFSLGTVNAPGQRYHPALIAQASATLAEMFPGRFWLALGSGEALNEHITGQPWIAKDARRKRVEECAAIIRSLWAGETVNHDGLVRVRNAKLFTRAATPPLIIGAAISVDAARWVGGWADGMITVLKPPEELKNTIQAFREGGGEGKLMFLQSQLCYARDVDEARAAAHDQWPASTLDAGLLEDLESPEKFDAATRDVTYTEIERRIRISADVRQHIAWLEHDSALGFDAIFLHNVGRNQQQFIDDFGSKVLPFVSQWHPD
jgi:coenzyme F420-dependent glucose-6-phosphate dehydrogenase